MYAYPKDSYNGPQLSLVFTPLGNSLPLSVGGTVPYFGLAQCCKGDGMSFL